MTAPDAPKPRYHARVEIGGVMVICFCCALLIGVSGMLWFAFAPIITPPPAPVVVATPIVLKEAPFPAVLVQAAAAYVAKATEQAPTPTVVVSPTPSPTPDPMKFCGIDSVQGELCRWPLPPLPTPTPWPTCATPNPNQLCYWRAS